MYVRVKQYIMLADWELCEFILGLLLNLYSTNCTIYFSKIPCTYMWIPECSHSLNAMTHQLPPNYLISSREGWQPKKNIGKCVQPWLLTSLYMCSNTNGWCLERVSATYNREVQAWKILGKCNSYEMRKPGRGERGMWIVPWLKEKLFSTSLFKCQMHGKKLLEASLC